MKFIEYNEMNCFWNDTQKLLEEKEWFNSLIIGNCYSGLNSDTNDWLFGIIKEKKSVEMIFLFMPPWKMLIYSPTDNYSNEIIAYLANEVYKRKPDLPGINTEKEVADKFAKKFCKLSGKMTKTHNFLRILLLEKMAEPKLRDDVIIRKATLSDKNILTGYIKEFEKEALHEEISDIKAEEKFYRYLEQEYYILEKSGKIVTQAVFKENIKNGSYLSCVFTPKEERGKAYAYNLVYLVSKKQLENGKKFCMLYTDDTNPISNQVYEKIGYKKVSNWEDIDFI